MASNFKIADAIRGDVGAASLAAMEAQAPVLHSERTIENITSEILQLKADAGNAIIGIGQRLTEAKALLPHGEWLPWLNDQVEFSERTAQEFMRISREWSNPRTLADLGKSKALKLLLLPPAEREEFMSAHDVPNMSTRELEDAIRERDEARKRAEALSDRVKTLEAHNTDLETRALDYSNENDNLKARVKELESAPKEVYQDEAAIKKAADDARRKTVAEWQEKTAKLDAELKKAEEKLKEAREKAKQGKADAEAGKTAGAELEAAKKAEADAKAEAERLRAELEEARRAQKTATVARDAELATFQLLFEETQTAVNKMRGLLLKVRGREDDALGEKLSAALNALADAVRRCAE